MSLLLKCFYKFVFYLWSDLSLPFRAALPGWPPPQPLGSCLLKQSCLVVLHPVLGAQPSCSGVFFLVKFISSYLYEYLLCQLVCIAYFDYRIKYLTDAWFFHSLHHHHPPRILQPRPSLWFFGGKRLRVYPSSPCSSKEGLWADLALCPYLYHFCLSFILWGQIRSLPTQLSVWLP